MKDLKTQRYLALAAEWIGNTRTGKRKRMVMNPAWGTFSV